MLSTNWRTPNACNMDRPGQEFPLKRKLHCILDTLVRFGKLLYPLIGALFEPGRQVVNKTIFFDVTVIASICHLVKLKNTSREKFKTEWFFLLMQQRSVIMDLVLEKNDCEFVQITDSYIGYVSHVRLTNWAHSQNLLCLNPPPLLLDQLI